MCKAINLFFIYSSTQFENTKMKQIDSELMFWLTNQELEKIVSGEYWKCGREKERYIIYGDIETY